MVLMSQERGQVALLLILAMAVAGVVSVSVASRSVEGLRTAEIDRGSTTAFKAAEAGLEQAILQKANVSGTLAGGDVSYNATYEVSGGTGFATALIDEGDTVSVSLVGASGITSIRIYWNGNAALKVSDLRGDTTTGSYGVRYYTSDSDTSGRTASNKFTATTEKGAYTFQGVSFQNRVSVPINLTSSPVSKILQATVLYTASAIGVEPIGGNLTSGLATIVSSTGSVNGLKSKVTLQRFAQKLPAIFYNVLYSDGSLSQ